MLIVTILLLVAATAVLLPVLSECLSLLRLPWVGPPRRNTQDVGLPSLLFLIPAHNEELLLPRCLASLRDQVYPAERRRVVVVADNCSDQTEQVARAGGAEVLARRDTSHRGKPFAIAWALEQLDLSRIDGMVIVDADTEVGSGFAAALAQRAPLSDKVLQPFIDVQNPEETALTRLAAVYANAVHGLAYRMKERVGLNPPLGVGMCIGAGVLRKYGWPAFSIGEDQELYAILTAQGVKIEPVSGARITAQEASGLRQSASQRHRWTAGRRQAFSARALQLLRSPHINFAQRLDALAELTWFGPVLALWFAGVGAALSWWLAPPGGVLIGWLFLASLIRPVGYSLWALLEDPAPGRALAAFFYLPVYFLWRLAPGIGSLFHGRSAPWVRTERHIGSEAPR